MWLKFQSTPPARGATTSTNRDCSGWFYFNPRPPRGGRQEHRRQITNGIGISIHAPREGGDYEGNWLQCVHYNFNPRPPRGGRLYNMSSVETSKKISIHAPREGGDRRRG